MKTGDLVFFKHKSPIVRLFDKSVNHVGIVICFCKMPMILEALNLKVVASPAKERLENKDYVVARLNIFNDLQLFHEQRLAINATQVLGPAPYSWQGYIFQFIWWLTGKWLQSHHVRYEAITAGQYVASLIHRAEPILLPKYQTEVPKNLMKLPGKIIFSSCEMLVKEYEAAQCRNQDT